jgi:hypothetical protein
MAQTQELSQAVGLYLDLASGCEIGTCTLRASPLRRCMALALAR